MPMIDKAFKTTNLSLKDMGLIVCDIGPGSFTGIRIGVATAKGFKDALNIPLIGISSLEGLAYNLRSNIKNKSLVLSFLDCKNDNCYFSLLEKNNDIFETLIEPMADTVENALSIVKTYIEDNFSNMPDLFVIGDGSIIYKDEIKSFFNNINFADESKNILNSYSLGIAGFKKFSNHFYEENMEVLPLYLKKPQAQRQLEEKEKNRG